MKKILKNQKIPFLVKEIRNDFPIFNQSIEKNKLIYFDNASTTQKPIQVIDAISNFYKYNNANVHRGVYSLAEKSTKLYEESRETVAQFINASTSKEIIFTRQATEAINLVVQSWGRNNLTSKDEIIITVMEHHANIVPWQILAAEKNFKIKIAPINDQGELIIEEFEKLFNEQTKFVSMIHTSNSLGSINPVKYIIDLAHNKGIPIMLDGSQSIVHNLIDVQALDCDFFVFSGHKIYGPTGIGVLYGKMKYLEKMKPYQGGGDMINKVTFAKTTFKAPPMRFEAGTPNISGAIGLAEAIKYISKFNHLDLFNYEMKLHDYATEKLKSLKNLQLIGTAAKKVSIISFILKNIHPHDIGTFLNEQCIAIRVGHHCNQPLMQRLKIPSTSRISFSFYNTIEEIDILISSMKNIIQFFNK